MQRRIVSKCKAHYSRRKMMLSLQENVPVSLFTPVFHLQNSFGDPFQNFNKISSFVSRNADPDSGST